MNARVQAQTVVDTGALWQLLGEDRPGLIGSGPYVAAYETAAAAMQAAADSLTCAYEAKVGALGIESDFVIDQGNVVTEIARRAKNHDLVIIGRRKTTEHRAHFDLLRVPRYSVSDHLLYYSSRPVVVVSNGCVSWKTARLVVDANQYDAHSLQSFLDLADLLGIDREIVCVGTSKELNCAVLDIRELIGDAQHISIVGTECRTLDPAWLNVIDGQADTLAVVAIFDDDRGAKSCLGVEPAIFNSLISTPSLLYLPHPANVLELRLASDAKLHNGGDNFVKLNLA